MRITVDSSEEEIGKWYDLNATKDVLGRPNVKVLVKVNKTYIVGMLLAINKVKTRFGYGGGVFVERMLAGRWEGLEYYSPKGSVRNKFIPLFKKYLDELENTANSL